MKAKHTLHVKRFVAGEEDDFGKVTNTFAEPEPIKVFSVGPAYSSEKGSLLIEGFVVGSPSDYGLTEQDRVVYKGKEYSIEGEIGDANMGPFDYRPGYFWNMRRSER